MLPESHASELDVAIIGAGWYGLSAARTLLKLEPNTKLVIFDGDDSVGGTWSRKRIYPNLVAQVGHGYFNYPGRPMPKDGATDHNLVSGDMIHRYLNKFAEDNDLKRRIRFNTWIEKVERSPLGDWRITHSEGVVETKKLILATGVTSIPSAPPFKKEAGAIPVIHSKHLAETVPKLESAKRFVIVGAAKSAYDAAYLLCSMGKNVTWVIRPDGSGPMPIMPSELFGLNTITVASTRMMNYLSPSMMTTNGWLGSFMHRTAVGKWLTKSHWRFITSRADNAAGFGDATSKSNVEGLKPDVKDASCFWCDSSLGLITIGDFWSTLKGADLRVVRDNVDSVNQGGALLRSGEQIDCDYLIYATGWGDHFRYFSPEMKDELGIPQYDKSTPTVPAKLDLWEFYDKAADEAVAKNLPLLAQGPDYGKVHPNRKVTRRKWRLYNRCIPFNNAKANDRSLAILGQIHTTQTPTVAHVQSLWAVLYLLGEVNLPSEEAIIKDIAEWNAWTRKRYSSVGERYPYALFDWIPYLDRLLTDMELKTQRTSNRISDFFTPYGPHCYANVLDEYSTKRSRRSPELQYESFAYKDVRSDSSSGSEPESDVDTK